MIVSRYEHTAYRTASTPKRTSHFFRQADAPLCLTSAAFFSNFAFDGVLELIVVSDRGVLSESYRVAAEQELDSQSRLEMVVELDGRES